MPSSTLTPASPDGADEANRMLRTLPTTSPRVVTGMPALIPAASGDLDIKRILATEQALLVGDPRQQGGDDQHEQGDGGGRPSAGCRELASKILRRVTVRAHSGHAC